MYKNFWKRIIDLVLAFDGIVLLSWLYVILAIIIFVDDPGPVFIVQRRVGKDGKIFKFIKFRSMKTNTPVLPGNKFDNPEQYITGFGKFLRKSSLDELPQLFNVLTGTMSLVGPRPSLENDTDIIEKKAAENAFSVRPGITGLAQVNGRDLLDNETKAHMDGEYVRTISFGLDFKIVCKTFSYILGGKDIHEGKSEENSK